MPLGLPTKRPWNQCKKMTGTPLPQNSGDDGRRRHGGEATQQARVGGGAAIESPASVAFYVYLIDTAYGKTIWKATFERTQRSLSENMGDIRAFFKTGAKWLTADQLARFGVNEAFKKYPF